MVIIITAACARLFRVRPVGRSGRPAGRAERAAGRFPRTGYTYSVAATVTYSARAPARLCRIFKPVACPSSCPPGSSAAFGPHPSTFEANPRGPGRFLCSEARGGVKLISDKKVSHAFFHRPLVSVYPRPCPEIIFGGSKIRSLSFY